MKLNNIRKFKNGGRNFLKIMRGNKTIWTRLYLAKDSDFEKFNPYPTGQASVEYLRYIGTQTNIEIPSTVKGETVNDCTLMFFNTKYTKLRVVSKNKVDKFSSMFRLCSSLKTLDLSSFDMSNAKELFYTFDGCHNLKSLVLGNLDGAKPTDLAGTFQGCSSLEKIDLSHLDTSNASDISNMFAGCSSLTTLDLSKFDISNVTNMKEMFEGCSSLKTIYVRSQADLDRFRNEGNLSESVNAIIKNL